MFLRFLLKESNKNANLDVLAIQSSAGSSQQGAAGMVQWPFAEPEEVTDLREFDSRLSP
jgi:hypothetical protein